MKTDPKSLRASLDALKEANSVRSERNKLEGLPKLNEHLWPPETILRGIPTLVSGIYKKPSEMLLVRFAYAGAWTEAIHGLSFLSVRQMEEAWADADIAEILKIRQECRDSSPPAVIPWNRITLFGVYREQAEEIYLVWGDDGDEPMIVSYVSNFEERFDDLGDFVLAYSRINGGAD